MDTQQTIFGEQPIKKADRNAGKRRNEARWRGSGRDWATPWDLFDRLDSEFKFTLDPCATVETAKVKTFFTETQDGLAQSWANHCVFMNPPYGAELPLWTRKASSAARDENATVVGLLPASTDLAWFHDHVLAVNAEIRYLRGRVRFKCGNTWASPFQPSIIVVWRPKRELCI